jgi:presenilin-like A22 family membrane protease
MLPSVLLWLMTIATLFLTTQIAFRAPNIVEYQQRAIAAAGSPPPPPPALDSRIPAWIGTAAIAISIVGAMSGVLWVVSTIEVPVDNQSGNVDLNWTKIIIGGLQYGCSMLLIGLARPRRIIRLPAMVLVMTTYLFWTTMNSWLLTNLMVVLAILNGLVFLRRNWSFARLAVIGVAITLLYDAIQVFYTGAMDQLIKPAVHESLPVLLVIPRQLNPVSEPAAFIGAGDIIIPGILVVAAAFIGARIGQSRLYWWSLAGYAIGLTVTIIMSVAFDATQPALIYLMPGVIGGVCLAAWRGGVLPELRQPAT